MATYKSRNTSATEGIGLIIKKMESLEQPVIDVKKIQEQANKAATDAYLKAVREYYTNYDSPYIKKIKEELGKQEFKWSLTLPDVMSKISESLSKEIDLIANNAIANSFIPLVSNSLTGLEKNLKLSDILKKIIKDLEPDRDEFDYFHFAMEEDEKFKWLSCGLTTNENYYEFTLHAVGKEKDQPKTYQLLSFPSNKYKEGFKSNMTVFKDDLKIEMPFTPGVLEDKVLNIFFRMMISSSIITIDCDGFNEDMLPEDEFCQC